jgi:hypothetical protein
METEQACFGASTGALMPVSVSVKSAGLDPVIAMEVRLTASLPILESVTAMGADACPLVTCAKFKLIAFSESIGPLLGCPPPLPDIVAKIGFNT